MGALETLVDLVNSYADSQGVKMCFCEVEKKYFCSVPFIIKSGNLLKGICYCADTIEKSAEGILKEINGKLLIFNEMSENRKEIFFYGLKPDPPKTVEEKPFLFRPHRGGFDESMWKTRIIRTREELISALREELLNQGRESDREEYHFQIEFYGYDKRIDWNTYIVSCEGYVLGFTNGPFSKQFEVTGVEKVSSQSPMTYSFSFTEHLTCSYLKDRESAEVKTCTVGDEDETIAPPNGGPL